MRLKSALILLALPAVLLLSSTAFAAIISQGYYSSKSLDSGTLVSTSPFGSGKVVAASLKYKSIIGVVAMPKDQLIEASSSSKQVQVVTSGIVPAFVSQLNGPINIGDPITISPIQGVGEKELGSGKIVGYAAEGFDTSATNITSVTIKAKDGSTTKTKVGLIQMNVQPGNYEAPNNSPLPKFVQQFASSLNGGRQVSLINIVIAGFIIILGTVLVFIIVAVAVQSAITSVGRNPLAKGEIYSGLEKTILISVIILLAVYGVAVAIIRL